MHLVLVHGAWHSSWCWDEHFVSYLTDAGYSCTAVTLPGHGSRPDPHARIWNRIPDYVSAVRETVNGIDGPVAVIGHSMGGLVTQRLLERPHPATVVAGVLMASVPPDGAGVTTLRAARRDAVGVGTAVMTANMWPIVSSEEKVRHALFSENTPAEVVRATSERLQNESYLAYLSMILRPPRPSRVDVPMLIVAAEQDGLFTTAQQRRLAHAYDAPYVEVPGSGHDIMLDTGWQVAADAILEWLPSAMAKDGA